MESAVGRDARTPASQPAGRVQLEQIGSRWRVVLRDGLERTVLSEHRTYEQAVEAADRYSPPADGLR